MSEFCKTLSNNKNTNKLSGSDTHNSLDPYQRNSNKTKTKNERCKAARYMLSGTKDADGLHPHHKIFCKAYGCKFCGPRKVASIRCAIAIAAEKFSLRVFATLTIDPRTCGCSPEESDRYIRSSWNKFRILQKREFGRGLEFVSVIEFQKSGYAHLHVLFDGFIPHAWLKNAWSSVGGGTIVDVRLANSGAPSYMAKYLAKSLRTHGDKKKFRRYSTSKNINLTRILRENKVDSGVSYRFCKVSEIEARDIFGPYIKGDIFDRQGNITGFRADRQLNPERTPSGAVEQREIG